MKAVDFAILICDAEWKNDKKLYEHYIRHGKEMSVANKKDYKIKSESLSLQSPGGDITRLETSRGTIVYKKSTGEAAIFVGNEMKSYYKLRKGQIKNERQNAKRIEDREKHK